MSAFTAGATRLTETLVSALENPATSAGFDLLANTNEVLSDVGVTAADSGGRLPFYGQDPIIASPHRFGAMAAIGLAAKSVAAPTCPTRPRYAPSEPGSEAPIASRCDTKMRL